MTEERDAPVLDHFPFWAEPISVFGSFYLTTCIESLHLLTIPSILAPVCLTLADPPPLTGVVAILRWRDTLSAGYLTVRCLPAENTADGTAGSFQALSPVEQSAKPLSRRTLVD
jgi:hypothetical protein